MLREILQKRKEKKKIEKEKLLQRREEIGIFREYFEFIAETLILVFFIITFSLQTFVIPSGSMEDTMLIGDHLVVEKISYANSVYEWEKNILPLRDINRGMIVTFKSPADLTKEYVKRVIGMPGDKIKIKNKKVYVNGKLNDENYVYHKDPFIDPGRDNFPIDSTFIRNRIDPTLKYYTIYKNFADCIIKENGDLSFVVPQGHYFCLGDNRDNSSDSRFWGPVPRDYIVGKPWRVYWSYPAKSSDYLNSTFFQKIIGLGKTAINFFSETRWKRTGIRID